MSGAVVGFVGEWAFLSNFHPAWVDFDGDLYPTVEHAYQAAKAPSREDRTSIRLATTPGRAKALGGRFSPVDWEDRKVRIMKELLVSKFINVGLQEKLLSTEDWILVEDNSWGDTFWGVCNGVGTNVLGLLLMEVRETLR